MEIAREIKELDTIVIGGGAAGLIAARELHESGKTVVLLEAQKRLGGRVYSREFEDTDKIIDLGGTYFNYSMMDPLLEEIKRYNLSCFEATTPRNQFWKLGDNLTEGELPDYTMEEWKEHERLCNELNKLASRVDVTRPIVEQQLEDIDYSLQQWLDNLELPQKVFETFKANYEMLTGSNLNEVSLLQIVVLGALTGEVDFLKSEELKYNFTHGAQSLINALVEEAGYDVRTNCIVKSIQQYDEDVRVETKGGDIYYAANIVVTVPFNTLHKIQFIPDLPPVMTKAIQQQNPCKSIKGFALTEGVEKSFAANGTIGSILWASTTEKYKHQQIIACFGNDGGGLTFTNKSFEDGLATYLPNISVTKVDGHNWNNDPWSLGGWMTWRPGWLTGDVGEFLGKPFGRVIFAGSDYTSYWTGWIAGAIASGKEVLKNIR